MATKSGTLVNDVKSPYSSPYVHYSASYTSTRADSSTPSISISLTFKAWLNSSTSKLGTGTSLIVYARISGGAWKSITIKDKSASWSGTTKHSASPITLTGSSTANKITVEFYVTRGDGGGNAGKLGTKSSPMKYSAVLPAYSSTPTPTPEPTPETVNYGGYTKVSGAWKKAAVYVKTSSAWKKTTPYVKTNGSWKKGVI